MFKSFEDQHSSVPFPFHITFVSAPCGSGKTHVACEYIKDIGRIEGNVLFVLPTKILIDDVQTSLAGKGVKSTKITSDTHPNHVRSGVLDAIKAAPADGLVLLITWNAYCELPYFNRPGNWLVFIDEVPQVDGFREWNLLRNRGFILDRVKVRPSGYDGLYRASAIKPRELDKLLQSDKDDVDDVFRDLYSCILSRNHEVFIDSASWDALVADTAGNGDGRLYTLSMLNRRLFGGAILMGANIEHSLLFSWLKLRHNVKFTKGGY